MDPEKRVVHVFIVSDATGVTAERVIAATLVQFNNNLKVANIPIIMGENPSAALFSFPKRIFGFTITPEKVALIRRKRLLYAGSGDYANIASIREELLFCNRVFRQIDDLHVIDVTNSSIEEIVEN